jgi:peptide/nickel transport system permease protein
VLIGITIVVYVILQLAPGGPQAKFANNPRMTNEQKAAFMKSWGLDQPIPIQYCRWMGICDRTAKASTSSARRAGPTSCRGDQRCHERHPPRRPRLLDLLG